MTNVILMFVGIALVMTVVVFLDWLARRKERQSEHRPAALNVSGHKIQVTRSKSQDPTL